MNDIEARLRDAYHAAVQTVSPDEIRELGEQSVTIGHTSHHAPGPVRRRIVTPVAAAAAVALIGVLTAVIIPGMLASPHRPVHAAGIKPAIRYAVELNLAGDMRSVIIRDVVTGAHVASVAAPGHGLYFERVATGDGRNYVAVLARPGTCRTWLYRFRLNGAGQPTALAPFRPAFIGQMIGQPNGQFVVSGDGRTLAFLGDRCSRTGLPATESISVLHLQTMRTTSWAMPARVGASVSALSLTADGSTIAYDVAPNIGPDKGVYILPADAAPGPALQRSRAVLRPAQFGRSEMINSAVITPDGKSIYFTTNSGQVGPAGYRWQLRKADVATGQTQVIRAYSRGFPEALSANPAVSQALVEIQRPAPWLSGRLQGYELRPSPSPSPTRTPRPSPSPSPTRTPRPSPSPSPTRTPRPSPTASPTPTPSPYQPRQVVLLINLATGARTILNPAVWKAANYIYFW
jgi:hypothetical protein